VIGAAARAGFVAALVAAVALVAPARAQELQAIPALEARVTDLTGTLDREQRARLEQQLATIEERKGAQVAVLVVPTTQPEPIEDYAIRVAETWKLGRAEVAGRRVDDGLLLLVAKNDRRVRIEVGYGLEGVVPDAIAKRIVAEVIAPRFREGDFFGGLSAAVDRIGRLIEGEALPPPEAAGDTADGHQPALAGLLVLLVGSMFAIAVLGRLVGSLLGGVGSAAFALFAGVSLVWATVVGFAAFIVLLVFAQSFLRGLRTGQGGAGSRTVWTGGTGWGAGGTRRGGFGGGGFRGGGGGFGGGGASGGW